MLLGLIGQIAPASPPTARFDWVEYRGVEPTQPDKGNYRNPVLPGFQPDPSIVGVGKDFYLINSSFGFFPGIPIYHSRDLVNWKQIGNALDRTDQIDLAGMGSQRGIFAPAITYHDKLFYIITTCIDCRGNFVLTAERPEGPWSKPHWLDFDGIDPSIFVDRDGRAWVTNNGAPEGAPAYEGHRAIWIQELDLASLKMVGPRKVLVNGGVDFSKKPIWIEGPHIYRKDGWYHMTAAEGGTAADHSQTIFRSRNVTGPYVPGPNNPILTQRDLDPGRANAVTATGHADFVQIGNGKWAAVFLGNRPYQGWLTNLGRETFMLPVRWEGGWPVILPPKVPVPLSAPMVLKPRGTGTDWAVRRDDFNDARLGSDWLSLRTRNADWYSLSDPAGTLSLTARSEPISGLGFPSFFGLRQRHHRMSYSTQLTFDPQKAGDRAGLVAFADEGHFFFFGIEQMPDGDKVVVRARSRSEGAQPGDLLATSSAPFPAGAALKLRIEADGPDYSFIFSTNDGAETILLKNANGRILATEYSGLLFTGTVIGPYAAREAN